MSNHTNNDIVFTELPGQGGNIGQITLNRPSALNALTTEMCKLLREQLVQWQADTPIKAVIIRGVGERAFCAGGDIRALYHGKQNRAAAIDFFRNEYRMNEAIFHFTKPYIAFLHGITMGGGAGVSIHGSHRVASDNLVFAMPETGIGFFPDIGAGFFLSRLKDKMGYYLGLTGDRIGVADAKWLSLITEIIPQTKYDAVIDALIHTPFAIDAHKSVTDILQPFTTNTQQSPLSSHQQPIIDCFSADTVEEAMLRLEENNSEWSLQITKILLTRSPISLKVTFEHLKRARTMAFNDVMQMEFNIALHFLDAPDFYEGVRAAVIDKDQSPRWNPSLLDEVPREQVARFFSSKETL